jgi:hypothetical protein
MAFRPLFCLAGRWLASIPPDHQEPDLSTSPITHLRLLRKAPF